jgi:hypothetical protein
MMSTRSEMSLWQCAGAASLPASRKPASARARSGQCRAAGAVERASTRLQARVHARPLSTSLAPRLRAGGLLLLRRCRGRSCCPLLCGGRWHRHCLSRPVERTEQPCEHKQHEDDDDDVGDPPPRAATAGIIARSGRSRSGHRVPAIRIEGHGCASLQLAPFLNGPNCSSSAHGFRFLRRPRPAFQLR